MGLNFAGGQSSNLSHCNWRRRYNSAGLLRSLW